MNVRVRFAPSPSGHLHVGGARTALFNYLFARSRAGVFVLRIEDTDAARSTDESVRGILDSLRWLGLTWDEGPGVGGPHAPYAQAQRRALYDAAARRLREIGAAYPCYCTADELAARREKLAARGEDSRYDGRCRALDDAARARLASEGRAPALRFATPASGEVAWDDVVRGRVVFQAGVLDDFVLVRSDGLPTYNFACVVDDHDMEITHVVRGDDHISNTPRQILLYRAFGWAPPVFAHVPMILGADGSRLSKRHGATSVEAFRDLGILPGAMVNFLALLGWSYDGQREIFSLAELERVFTLERVGTNPAVFSLEKLEWMNGQHLRQLDAGHRQRLVEEFLAARGRDLSGRPPEWRALFVRALGERLRTLADAERYGAFALDETLDMDEAAWAGVRARPEAGPHLAALADALAALPSFDLERVEQATRGRAAELGMKAGELIGLARVALTGRTFSPGIFEVMALLGRERTVERLRAAAARWAKEAAATAG
uniref:Glutamate--tRNA ligase n=1 Tax=Eiseniibacteriota bacterium TaxID=2212470 RepID=A0A832MLU4_UNCEI